MDPPSVAQEQLKGSKYAVFNDSGLKNHTPNCIWDQESLNIGYLDPLGRTLPPFKM